MILEAAGGSPPEVDLPVEQRKVVRNGALAAGFCAIVLASGYFVLPRYFPFPTDLAGALVITLQADLFVFIWVAIGVRLVSRVRFHSAADNAGSAFQAPSPRIAVQLAFLQNTLEQAVIAVGAHLALATLLSGPGLTLIPSAVLLFAIGRLTFLAGYREGAGGRAFGIVVTALPSIAGYLLAIALIVMRVF